MGDGSIILLAVGLIAGATIASATSGGTNSDAGQAADVVAVEQVWTEYAAAVNDGDFERWISLWIDDGIRMSPSNLGPRQVGKEQIRAAMQPLFDSSDQEMTINSDAVQILGERAYSHGTFAVTVTPKDGGDALVLNGNFLTILEKQGDGS